MMTDQDVDKDQGSAGAPETDETAPAELVGSDLIRQQAPLEKVEPAVPVQLGATRYVLAGFFAAGMAVAYLVSRILNGVWNRLADNAWVSKHTPFLTRVLTRIAEEDRSTYTALLGAAAGVAAVVYAYRRPDVRGWTSEVAAELAKVSWPSKKEVTNSTMIVIVASAFATVFLALLDRFWGFVTNLVYGS